MLFSELHSYCFMRHWPFLKIVIIFTVITFLFFAFLSSGFKMYTVLFGFFMGCLNNFFVFLACMARQWLFYF